MKKQVDKFIRRKVTCLEYILSLLLACVFAARHGVPTRYSTAIAFLILYWVLYLVTCFRGDRLLEPTCHWRLTIGSAASNGLGRDGVSEANGALRNHGNGAKNSWWQQAKMSSLFSELFIFAL